MCQTPPQGGKLYSCEKRGDEEIEDLSCGESREELAVGEPGSLQSSLEESGMLKRNLKEAKEETLLISGMKA